VIHLVVLLGSLLLMLKTATFPDNVKIWIGLPVVFWQGVAASAFAAALVSLFQLLATTTDNAERMFCENEELKFKKSGLLEVFTQRGTAEASKCYDTRIRTARERIWAIGMTNGKLISDHGLAIIEAAKKHKSLDVIIAFWNPKAELICRDFSMPISDIQAMLENGSPRSTNTADQIETRQSTFQSDIVKQGKLQGRIRILNLCLPSNFTAFMFDEEVFFFPFLGAPTSAVTPTLLVANDEILGKGVLAHFQKLFQENDAISSLLVQVVFDSSKTTQAGESISGGAIK